MTLIYHIAAAADWEQAQRDGQYTMSTRGRTLAEEGFIHASTAEQVPLVAAAYYRDAPDLVLLVIDTERVGSPIRYEQVPGQPDPYPHIYGPLNLDAILETRPSSRPIDRPVRHRLSPIRAPATGPGSPAPPGLRVQRPAPRRGARGLPPRAPRQPARRPRPVASRAALPPQVRPAPGRPGSAALGRSAAARSPASVRFASFEAFARSSPRPGHHRQPPSPRHPNCPRS